MIITFATRENRNNEHEEVWQRGKIGTTNMRRSGKGYDSKIHIYPSLPSNGVKSQHLLHIEN